MPNVQPKTFSFVTQVSELDLQEFTSILGSEGVITDPHDVEPYNVDWLRIVRYNGINYKISAIIELSYF